MSMAITLSLLGAFLAIEAVTSLVIGIDRRAVTIVARVLRILCGGYLVMGAVVGWFPSVVVNVNVSLGSWNSILQTSINAIVMGVSVFLSTRYMSRFVEKIERRNIKIKNGEDDNGKPKSSS